MKSRTLTVLMITLLFTNIQASELMTVKEGTRVCITEGSLTALHEALLANNDNVINWLTDGAACMITHTDLDVEVIEVTEQGYSKVRTTRKRKNLTLWTSVT